MRCRWGTYPRRVLLSDKDIRAEIDTGRVRIDPYDESMVQPSSIDVRLDRYFRVFENHRYPHIDPAVEQSDLTRLIETDDDEPFVLFEADILRHCRRLDFRDGVLVREIEWRTP